ncbi:hypothetical protein CBR_g25802 [Chara braunii]|uniref:DUF4360 domain-containing protein n=1 Tax=Chara braunii TaxID=69332 RepID=A0A388L6D9_CHABU|nr:hypothetical protein CBR_g25802 [Chara braunii]|eukprot:GBG77870.1 hypothetical protein CBR_g25802 [Chara braunii]
MRHRLFQSVSTMAAMVVLLMLGLLQLALPGLAQSPPPGTVKIEDFVYAGTGCPPGSAGGIISLTGKQLTVAFSAYNVSTPGSPAGRRKNCQVAVSLSFPAGFTFTLVIVTFRGFAEFQEGVQGTLVASYYLAGIEQTERVVKNLPPPVRDNFNFTDSFPAFIYPQCNSTSVLLNINSEARVVPPPPPMNNNEGVINVDAQDLALIQQFSLTWRSC